MLPISRLSRRRTGKVWRLFLNMLRQAPGAAAGRPTPETSQSKTHPRPARHVIHCQRNRNAGTKPASPSSTIWWMHGGNGRPVMTRINCIPPHELTGPHLVAEYRELPRVFALVRAAIERGERPDDPRNPAQYTLGVGHVRFFYCRLGYLVRRQASLVEEMKTRGFHPKYDDVCGLLDGFPKEWCQDWEPTPDAVRHNRARIAERMRLSKRR